MQNKLVRLKRNVTTSKWEGTNQATPPEQLPKGMKGEIVGRMSNYYGDYTIFKGLDGIERYVRDIDLEPA